MDNADVGTYLCTTYRIIALVNQGNKFVNFFQGVHDDIRPYCESAMALIEEQFRPVYLSSMRVVSFVPLNVSFVILQITS